MSWAAKFHLVSTVMWGPITVLILVLGLYNAVWIVFALSIYANLKTDWGDYHAARSDEKKEKQ